MKAAATRARRPSCCRSISRSIVITRAVQGGGRASAPHIEDRGIDEIYIDLTAGRGRAASRRRLWQRARRSCTVAEGCGARGHGLSCSIARCAQQAAGQDRLRTRQAGWPDVARGSRHPGAHLAAAAAQDQRHRPQGERAADALGIRPSASWPPRPPWLVDHFGRSHGAWMHEAATRPRRSRCRNVQRAEIDQPRNHVRSGPACRRDRDELGEIFTAPVRAAGRRPAAQGLRGKHAGPQAAFRRLPHGHPRPHLREPTAGAPRSDAPPANA